MLAIIGEVTGEHCVHDNPKDETGDVTNGMPLDNEDKGQASNLSELTTGPPVKKA